VGHPEAALVGEIADGRCFFADVAPHGIPVVNPPGGLQVLENFVAIGQVHESATQVVLEIAVSVFGEAGVLGAGGPAAGLGPPHGPFGFGMFAIVSGEDEGGTHGATCADAAERGPAIVTLDIWRAWLSGDYFLGIRGLREDWFGNNVAISGHS
tara:strand:- start:218 stop:679 length:462 start_codon:yes stop_codon:yes gene_type:complete